MNNREEYIHRRLMELALIAETRELDPLEKQEEVELSKELELGGKVEQCLN